MNERIEELIVAYLHRGTTPEQEQELFRACSGDPDIAAKLRQHLSLSLTLRQLRDTTEVPADLRNSLLGKINTLKPAPDTATQVLSFGVRTGIFKWRHVVGTALAGAALAAIGFFAFQTGTVTNIASVQTPATVQVVRTDTVMQYRDIPKIVYVVRSSGKPAGSSAESVDNFASIEAPGPISEKPNETLTSPAATQPVTPKPIDNPIVEKTAKTESFTEQYGTMLATLEKIKLSETDRVRD